MIQYDKLVRDRIPEILESAGIAHQVRVLDETQYAQKLDEKLGEEFAEYQESGSVEELVDIVEIARAIADRQGINWEQFNVLMDAKRAKRGGFAQRLLLVSAEEG